MHTFKEFNALVESMAVHAHSLGGGKFKIHKVGSAVKHVKVGDEVTSSDLDDLADAGHKVKETKNPKVVKEESEAHKKAEMKTLRRLEKKTDKLIAKDKAVHKKLGEETLSESSHEHPLHSALVAHGLKHQSSEDGTSIYAPGKSFKQGQHGNLATGAMLNKNGYEYHSTDREGKHELHYFEHKKGHAVTVITTPSGKVLEMHAHSPLKEETLHESSHDVHGALKKAGYKAYSSDEDTFSADDTGHTHQHTAAILKAHGFKRTGSYVERDSDGNRRIHDYEHKDGRQATVTSDHKTGKTHDLFINTAT